MLKRWQTLLKIVPILAVFLMCSGCAQLNFSRNSSASSGLAFAVDQIQPSNRPGIYSVSGRANLPDKTTVVVSAIRQLNSTARQNGAKPEYSILSRQQTQVKGQTWKVDLNLWQVAPDGQYQEAWQLTQSAKRIESAPNSTVLFLASVNPANQPPELTQQIENLTQASQGNLVQFTAEGDPYLQASRSLPVALPTGQTTAPPQRSLTTRIASDRISDVDPVKNQNRSVLPPGKTDVTTAPLMPQEFVR
jgi:hypothetical protein